jgi:hypothetical protein
MTQIARATTPRSIIERVNGELAIRPSADDVGKAVMIMVASCMRSSDLTDEEAECRVALVREVLLRYPRFVVREIADPTRGIVADHKFFPTVSEIKQFADRMVERRIERRRRAQEALEREAEERKNREWEAKRPPASERAAHVEAVMRKSGLKGISSARVK